jgi:hypothetical protein
MSRSSLRLIFAATSLMSGAIALAQTGPVAAKPDPRAAIASKIEGLHVEDVRISPVTGIYEITRDSMFFTCRATGATPSSAT